MAYRRTPTTPVRDVKQIAAQAAADAHAKAWKLTELRTIRRELGYFGGFLFAPTEPQERMLRGWLAATDRRIGLATTSDAADEDAYLTPAAEVAEYDTDALLTSFAVRCRDVHATRYVVRDLADVGLGWVEELCALYSKTGWEERVQHISEREGHILWDRINQRYDVCMYLWPQNADHEADRRNALYKERPFLGGSAADPNPFTLD
ncbi:hypothetical protein [Streptomyces noursei]